MSRKRNGRPSPFPSPDASSAGRTGRVTYQAFKAAPPSKQNPLGHEKVGEAFEEFGDALGQVEDGPADVRRWVIRHEDRVGTPDQIVWDSATDWRAQQEGQQNNFFRQATDRNYIPPV